MPEYAAKREIVSALPAALQEGEEHEEDESGLIVMGPSRLSNRGRPASQALYAHRSLRAKAELIFSASEAVPKPRQAKRSEKRFPPRVVCLTLRRTSAAGRSPAVQHAADVRAAAGRRRRRGARRGAGAFPSGAWSAHSPGSQRSSQAASWVCAKREGCCHLLAGGKRAASCGFEAHRRWLHWAGCSGARRRRSCSAHSARVPRW